MTAVGELSGAVFGALAFMRFVRDNVVAAQHSWPLDASLVFNISALLCVALYFVSLTLHVNIVGDYGGDNGGKEDGAGDDDDDYLVGEDVREKTHRLPSRCGIWGEILHVPASDLAVLIEQATWR